MKAKPMNTEIPSFLRFLYRDHKLFAFMADTITELQNARRKFPSSELSAIALMEEVGEVSRALLQEPSSHVRAECVQVAVMAIRLALEGDPSISPHRARSKLNVHPAGMPF